MIYTSVKRSGEAMKKLPIGISDFKEMMMDNYYYIDKSFLIQEVVELGSKAMLMPRPRRFGKTLNLSMLKYFFEKTEEDLSYLFKDLAIWQVGKEYRDMQGIYPVIFLTFKDVKNSDWEGCFEQLKVIIADEYRRHDYLLRSSVLSEIEKETYINITHMKAHRVIYETSLRKLSEYLEKHYNQKVMIFIDEYDTPIQAGYLEGYYKKGIEFIRNFLSGGLKDNTSLERAVLTGILKVAKESIFTGLNNFKVYSILTNKFSRYFGLLEEEVIKMMQDYEITDKIVDIKDWYNGYIFGKNIIYNPWSIVNFVDGYEEGFVPYWVNTSGNELIKRLITTSNTDIKEDIEKLMRGESITKVIDDNMVFEDLDRDDNLIWSFLLFTGYLKATEVDFVNEQNWEAKLFIPNKEVAYFYKKTLLEWFRSSTSSVKLRAMLQGIIEGEIEVFEYHLKQFVLNTMSYFDPTGEEPERVYQGFVLGMLVNLTDHYIVKANRESGLGRYDIAIIPKDTMKKAMILEFKKVDPARKETLETALEAAIAQIQKNKYDTDLKEAGIREDNIVKAAIAFKGKELMMRGVT